MAAPIRVIFLCVILVVFMFGIVDYLTNFERNGCQMTYMYEYPEYLKIKLNDKVSKRFANYGLYIYGEGNYAVELRKSVSRLKGIPVLFIPGNAGSYQQVRSLGSVAYRKGDDAKSKFHFNFFTLDLNEEPTGGFGGTLQDQTAFTAQCIQHILTLYKGAPSPPKTVLVVGHSMGGIIARGIFTLPKFDKKLVHTIITQATPHQAPVISMDSHIASYYSKVNTYWQKHHNTTLKDVTVVSTGGGYRDILVSSHLTSLANIVDTDKAVSSNTMSVPRAFVSTDHLCHVWCKQIVLATVRALYDIVDRNTKQIAVNPNLRVGAFQHHLLDTPGSRQYKGAYNSKITFDSKVKWSIRKVNPWNFKKDKLNETRYSVVKLPQFGTEGLGYVAISSIDNVEWLYLCSQSMGMPKTKQKLKEQIKSKPKEERCHHGENLSPLAMMLPPYTSEKRVVTLTGEQLTGKSHIVAVIPKSNSHQEISGEIFHTDRRLIEYNVTDLWSFITKFPTSVMELDMVIKETQSKAMYYNITLRGLEVPLQAYEVYMTTVACSEKSGGRSVLKFHVPWAVEDTFTTVIPGGNGKLSIKLQNGRPKSSTDWPSLHLYLNPQCTYKLAVGISWRELFGQFIRFYGIYLPAFVVIQVLMSLAYQLKMLDEEATVPSLMNAHGLYAQPWRVVPVALIIRFMLYFPEDMPLASRIYLPADDASWLIKMGIWYPALPIILYLVGYSIFGMYTYFVTAVVAVMGKIFAITMKRCCLSLKFVTVTTWLQYVLLFAALPLAYFVCGTLAIVIVYFIFFAKMFWTYAMAYYSGVKEKQIWNRHNMTLTLVILLMMTITLNAPSLYFWIQHAVKNSEYVLKSDPSRGTGVMVVLAAILLSYAQFPRISSELYGAMSSLIYFSSILMVIYCLTSFHRISYFICTAFMLIAIPATILKVTFTEKAIENRIEEEYEEDDNTTQNVVYTEDSDNEEMEVDDNEDENERGIIPEPEMPHMTYRGDDAGDRPYKQDLDGGDDKPIGKTRASKRNKKKAK